METDQTPALPLLADRLKWARERAGLDQYEVAARAGLSKATYNRLELDKNKTTGRLVQIAEVLGVNPTWLGTGTGSHFVTKITKLDLQNANHFANILRLPIKKWSEIKGNGLDGMEMAVFRYKLESDQMAGNQRDAIPEGSILTVDTSPDLVGALGAVHIADIDGHFAIGKLQQQGPRLFLRPVNYPALEVERGQLVGVVTGYHVEFTVTKEGA